jgi:hypothetical protein
VRTFQEGNPLVDHPRETFPTTRVGKRAAQRARVADRIIRDFAWLADHSSPEQVKAVAAEVVRVVKARHERAIS